MPADDSPAVLIARFLRANHYAETLDVYLKEAGLPPDAGRLSKDSFTIEKLLEEKRAYDVSTSFEKLDLTVNASTGWKKKAPTLATVVSTLPSASNLLHTSLELVRGTTKIIATASDRSITMLDVPDLAVQLSSTDLQDSPILSCAELSTDYLLCTSMSGQLVLATHDFKPVESRRDHSKYVVQVISQSLPSQHRRTTLVATAGWDAKVNVYRIEHEDTDRQPAIPPPSNVISLTTNPESILFVHHPDAESLDSDPILVVTRRDSSFLYFYSTTPGEARLLGKQNLAPHSNAWVAFTPSSIASSPTDPTLIAVATSSVPHMKLLIVRLLLPPLAAPPGLPPSPAPSTTTASASDRTTRAAAFADFNTTAPSPAAEQARQERARQEAESAAIKVHANTLAPQTQYSTPALAWRPDGSGVWVNGDDGAVRGVEAVSGKLVATLAGGHEPGSKVRCLAAGVVTFAAEGEGEGQKEEEEEEEWLVTGGFDQRLIVWRPDCP